MEKSWNEPWVYSTGPVESEVHMEKSWNEHWVYSTGICRELLWRRAGMHPGFARQEFVGSCYGEELE